MKSIILQEKELKIARSVLLAAHLEQKKLVRCWQDSNLQPSEDLVIKPKSDALTIAPQHPKRYLFLCNSILI